jgi:hypothetical protein
MREIFGQSSQEPFARYDLDTSCWKTCQDSLLQTDDDSSEASYPTWPPAGTMRNGSAYRLPTLERPTCGDESGLLPTPVATEYTQNQNAGLNAKVRPTLIGMARYGRWPTPRNNTGPSMDAKHLSLDGAVRLWPTPTVDGNYNRAGLSPTSGDGLATAVAKFPTPTALMMTEADMVQAQYSGNSGNRPDYRDAARIGGKLNPDWVCLLMGYPLDWLDLGEDNDAFLILGLGDQDGKMECLESAKVVPIESPDLEDSAMP